ncbi:MAG: M64 family metallopeptidase, partial [Limnohabitans sp.]|nr:M64 family metallopeptidase [Limnohabitans sp.]
MPVAGRSRRPVLASTFAITLVFTLEANFATTRALADPLLVPSSLEPAPPDGGKANGDGIPQGKDHLYCCHPGPAGTLVGKRLEVDLPTPLPPLDSAWNSETVRWWGPSSNRIDMVFVGDGYQADDQGLYRTQVDLAWQFLEQREPYATYRRYFNVHRVYVISTDEGVDNDPMQGISRNTALDMRFWADGVTDRLLGINTAKAQQAAASAPDWDQILALANSPTYGGAGYAGANVSTCSGGNAQSFQIAEHELGHAFGELADEYQDPADPPNYAGPELAAPNVSIRNRAMMIAADTKWVHWLGVELPVVGVHDCFEGAYYHNTGVFRPTLDSLMRTLDRPFNGPSIEQMIVKIHLATQMAEYFTHAPGTSVRAGGSIGASLVKPIGHDLVVRWRLGGALLPDESLPSIETGLFTIPPGGIQLSLEVTDPNPLVRNPSNRANIMKETYSWTLLPQDGLSCSTALTITPSVPTNAWFDTRVDLTPSDETPCGIGDQWSVWRRVVATCSGMMTVTACPTSYATGKASLAMSEECGAFAACSLDSTTSCSAANASSLRFGVVAGEDYYIRISAVGGGDVAGELFVSCAPISPTGDCFAEHSTGGCSSSRCFAAVCTVDPFCCDQFWDDLCVQRAESTCRTGYNCDQAILLSDSVPSSYQFYTFYSDGWEPSAPSPCGVYDVRTAWRRYIAPSSGMLTIRVCTEFAEAQMTLALYEDCSQPLESITCSASVGSDCVLGNGVRLDYPVLAGHSYLIRVAANNAQNAAGTLVITNNAVCGQGGVCDTAHFTPGCNDAECCVAVCAADPYCCTNAWDSYCVQGATSLCFDVVGDINNDGVVNASDLAFMLGAGGSVGGAADLDQDGSVGASDLSLLLSN